jgi:hypothetical protein
MIQSTAGTQVLEEADIIDIVKQHFYKYGQGFKQVRLNVSMVEYMKPKISLELALVPLNPALPNEIIDKIYYSLLNTCKETGNVENAILDKIYEMVSQGTIDNSTFIALIKKLKGS